MSTHTPPAASTALADILVERREGVAIVTLNRPRERNPLGLAFPDEMLGVLQQLDDDLGLHAVVLTGAGNVFCAGAELGQVVNLDGGDAELQFRFIHGPHKVVQHIRELELPVIAAVNGAAVGGGAALAVACDIAVASDKARYFFAFGRLGAAACDMGCSTCCRASSAACAPGTGCSPAPASRPRPCVPRACSSTSFLASVCWTRHWPSPRRSSRRHQAAPVRPANWQ